MNDAPFPDPEDLLGEEGVRPAPPGWVQRSFRDTFGAYTGPLYFREEGKRPGVGFYSDRRHRNLADVVHGGMLMTLADMSLFDICMREVGFFRAVTVSLNAEFLAPAPLNAFIEADGEMTRGGKSLFFARGLVRCGETALLSFSGTLKKVG